MRHGDDASTAGNVEDVPPATTEARLHFLARASSVLAASLDQQTALSNLVELLVPFLADSAGVLLRNEQDELRVVAQRHRDPTKEQIQQRLIPYYESSQSQRDMRQVLQGGGPLPLQRTIDPARLPANAVNEEHLALLRELDPRAHMLLPLAARGEVFGGIMLMMGNYGRTFSDDDVQLAQEVAAFAALVIDNTRLYQAAQKELAERRRVERELRSSRHQLEVILGGVADGITVQNDRSEIIYANPAAARLSGFASPEEMLINTREVVKQRFDIFDEQGNKLTFSQLPGARALQGEASELVLRYEVIETGEERWSIVKASPVFDEHGAVQYAINIFSDISARKRAEEALLRARSELEQRVAERTAELSEANAILQRQMEERQLAEEARLAIERKLLETQKLESLGLLAGGIAHDFNNLLLSILGNAELALFELEPNTPLHEPLSQINTAARRAAELTQQILAYAGKGRFLMHRISINALLEEMAQLLKASLPKHVVLQFELAEQLPEVVADATQLRQVIMNLIVNAGEALEGHPGNITLYSALHYATRQELDRTLMGDQLGPGDYVLFEVRDSGRGMDAEMRVKIFDPFFTTKFTGRGLGLAAVQGIIRRHGGTLSVDSAPGQGTVFRVLLPQAEAMTMEGPTLDNAAAAPTTSPRAGCTVLIIDDEEHILNVTGQILRRIGFNVLCASDAGQALAHASQAATLDCVLLDMTMPNVSSEKIARELSSLRPDIRIILMSGYSVDEANSRFAEIELSGFLQKPFTIGQLQELLNKVLGK